MFQVATGVVGSCVCWRDLAGLTTQGDASADVVGFGSRREATPTTLREGESEAAEAAEFEWWRHLDN